MAPPPASQRLGPLLSLLLLRHSIHPCEATATVDLDASPWDFEADPEDIGTAERWYDAKAKPQLERTITSPGAWEARASVTPRR